MSHKDVTKVAMSIVSGFGVPVSISCSKVQRSKVQRLDNSRKKRNIRALKHLNPEPKN